MTALGKQRRPNAKLYNSARNVHHAEIASRRKVKLMEAADLYREHVLNAVVEATPEGHWRRLAALAQFTYGEAFSAVLTDLALVQDQRPQKLYQERYFKMEHSLMTAARESGMSASSKLIGTNMCHYAYVAAGGIGMTQSYVPISGEMPSPAAFRKQLAEVAQFERSSRLDLGDEPSDLLLPKEIIGIVLHSPVGRRFTKEDQQLGAIGFFVPYRDYRGWAVGLPLQEIMSAYKPADAREDRATGTRRKIGKTGTAE
jgi:hypothetical protein